jgi:hypothetical protein
LFIETSSLRIKSLFVGKAELPFRRSEGSKLHRTSPLKMKQKSAHHMESAQDRRTARFAAGSFRPAGNPTGTWGSSL